MLDRSSVVLVPVVQLCVSTVEFCLAFAGVGLSVFVRRNVVHGSVTQ